MKLDVFGRLVEITRSNNRWHTFYCGNEGKKRIAEDIKIPDNISESDVVGYVADLCHEWATSANPGVNVIAH